MKSKRVDDCGSSPIRIVLCRRSSFVGDDKTLYSRYALLLYSVVTKLPIICTIGTVQEND